MSKAPRQRQRQCPASAVADADTRQRILDTALKLFYSRGYEGTSLGAIADEVGIAAPSLYWHFAGKRDLCFECLQQELGRFLSSLERAAQAADPESRLRGFVHEFVHFRVARMEIMEQPALGHFQLRLALEPDQRQQVDAIQRSILDLTQTILSDGREDGVFAFDTLTATAFAVINACEYVFTWYQPGGRLSVDEVAEEYGRLMLAMVRAN